tara:strand:+ start:128 stop:610 length:483 start_codon:yes stop_codon:yes gene_type:complete
MKTHSDTFTYLLSNNTRDLGTLSNPIFNINYLQKKNNYTKITCYIDNLQAVLLTLSNTTNLLYLESSLNQINSYSSKTKATSNILCVINRNIQEHSSSGYQDSAVSYQAPQTPIEIGSLPDSINFKLTQPNGSIVDMDTGGNVISVKLRFVCEYEVQCGC